MKAQVTIWIILGIVLVVIFGTVVYLSSSIVKSDFERELEKASLVPQQIQPVKTHIDQCLFEITQEAIDIIGIQGGHLQLPEDPLPRTPANQFSNALEVSPNGNLRTAYWFYESANGIKKQQVPSLVQIENDVATYVTNNLDTCLNFAPFIDQGFEIVKKDIEKTNVGIFDENIQVITEMQVFIKREDIEFTIDKHLTDMKVSLGKLYNIAKKISEKENSEYFLEEKTIDMLVAYDEIPFSNTEFDCKQSIWAKQDVIKDLRRILQENILSYKIRGAEFSLAEDDSTYLVFDVTEDNLDDVHVNFRYSKDWPLKLEVFPEDEDILTSDYITDQTTGPVARFLSTLFCINNYHFIYDIKYPVLVVLSSNDYIFQFATQVIIDNNQPRENLLGPEETFSSEPVLCNNKITDFTINTFILQEESLVPIGNADISFKCSGTTCKLGTTNSNGILNTKVPQCTNALISAAKTDYSSDELITSTLIENEVTLFLQSFFEKEVEVKLIEKNFGTVRSPYESEQVIFNLEVENYKTFYLYPNEDNKLKLIPGSYKINSFIIGESTWPVQLQEQTIEKCVSVPERSFFGLFGAEDEECVTVTMEGSELDQIVKGGANFNLFLSESDLINSEKIVLYSMVDEFPSNMEELLDIYQSIEDNARSDKFIFPQLE